MPQIKWRPRAIEDIRRLQTFLRDKNPAVAQRAIAAIRQGAEILRTVPLIGQPLSDGTSRREWTITFGAGAYILRYIPDENADVVLILRVWHSRENRGE